MFGRGSPDPAGEPDRRSPAFRRAPRAHDGCTLTEHTLARGDLRSGTRAGSGDPRPTEPTRAEHRRLRRGQETRADQGLRGPFGVRWLATFVNHDSSALQRGSLRSDSFGLRHHGPQLVEQLLAAAAVVGCAFRRDTRSVKERPRSS